MKSFIKIIIAIFGIIYIIVGGIVAFNTVKPNNNNSTSSQKDTQSNERDIDKIQIEIVADVVKIRESKDPNSQVIGNVYKNEIYSVLSEDKESQYKWLEIETANGIKGYIVGIEAYVKKLKTTIIEEEQKPIIDNNTNNDTNNNNNSSNNDKPTNNTKPNNNTTKNENTTTNNQQNNNSSSNQKEEPIVLKKIWMENEGGTFHVGDTITIHASVESKNKLRSAVVWFHSLVNEQSIKSAVSYKEIIDNSNIIIVGTITEDMLPGMWEYNWSYFDDQYGLFINDWKNGRFKFLVE